MNFVSLSGMSGLKIFPLGPILSFNFIKYFHKRLRVGMVNSYKSILHSDYVIKYIVILYLTIVKSKLTFKLQTKLYKTRCLILFLGKYSTNNDIASILRAIDNYVQVQI